MIDYPINAIFDIGIISFSNDICDIMEEIISLWGEKEQKVFRLHYKQNKKINEIANIVDLGVAETNAILIKCKESFLHSSNKILECIKLKRRSVNERDARLMSTPIKGNNLFTVRMQNALIRAGINTVYDASNLFIEGLMYIRNMGKKSASEAIRVLKENYGIELTSISEYDLDNFPYEKIFQDDLSEDTKSYMKISRIKDYKVLFRGVPRLNGSCNYYDCNKIREDVMRILEQYGSKN